MKIGDSGWISPEGEYYECCPLAHLSLAEDLVKEFHEKDWMLRLREHNWLASQLLDNYGYIRISRCNLEVPDRIRRLGTGEWPITASQYDRLIEIFNANERKIELNGYNFRVIAK